MGCLGGFKVLGIDNNLRRYFFGNGGDVTYVVKDNSNGFGDVLMGNLI